MSAEGPNPVSYFLASVIAHAADAQDPKVDRLAMIAGDLLDRITAQRERVDNPIARLFGWTGPVAGLDRPKGIAADVLARAQASLDGEEPDPAAISAGIGAARRLIATTGATGSDGARAYMARVLLGGNGGYAPRRFTGDVGADEEAE
jgi:hypothetical protein